MVNQKQIVQKLGVSQSTVSRWYSGHRRPSVSAATRFEKVTGISAYKWVFETQNALRHLEGIIEMEETIEAKKKEF